MRRVIRDTQAGTARLRASAASDSQTDGDRGPGARCSADGRLVPSRATGECLRRDRPDADRPSTSPSPSPFPPPCCWAWLRHPSSQERLERVGVRMDLRDRRL